MLPPANTHAHAPSCLLPTCGNNIIRLLRACASPPPPVAGAVVSSCLPCRALRVLRNPNASRELLYKFAPALVAAAPSETVDFFVSAVRL